ncbi:MAG: hypothetical protein UZ12_BCD005001414 [Bacteroidetes bacterium OLB12]|nr:MAG: hypothetical protein UZ12_BCD005001414 [Bacteroidetes bacterium OLB12]
MSNNSKRVINKGSKFPGCVYIDSSLVFTNKLIRIKNCQRTMTNIQNIQVIKRVDSLNYIINICYLPGKKLSLNDINEGFTLDMYKKLSTKFVELKIRDLGDRVLIESISDTPKYERYELKKIDNSFFLTLENFKSELNF